MDRHHRQIERNAAIDPSEQGRLLRSKIRAQLPLPLPRYREEPCLPSPEQFTCDLCGTEGHACHSSSIVDASCNDVLRLQAALGSNIARELLPLTCGVDDRPDGGCAGDGGDCYEHQDQYPIELWFNTLQSRAENLGELIVETPATDCPEFGNYGHRSSVCGCGKFRIAYSRYLSIWAAWSAAAKALPAWRGCEGQGNYEADTPSALGCDTCKAPRRVIDACAKWLACPCPKRRDELHYTCGMGSGQRGAGLPEWVWLTSPRRALIACAQIITPEQIRAAVKLALIGEERDER